MKWMPKQKYKRDNVAPFPSQKNKVFVGKFTLCIIESVGQMKTSYQFYQMFDCNRLSRQLSNQDLHFTCTAKCAPIHSVRNKSILRNWLWNGDKSVIWHANKRFEQWLAAKWTNSAGKAIRNVHEMESFLTVIVSLMKFTGELRSAKWHIV